MTDRSPPDATDAPDLILAYVDGALDAPLRAELEARMRADPALLAEVEGLQAVRALLDKDAQYGRDSQLDVPPPHLLDAILRAEVLARPDEIRQAVALARTAPDADKQKPLWARLSSWLIGGGVVVGAAAAVLVVVTQGDLEPPSAAAVQTAAVKTDEAPPPPPPMPVMPLDPAAPEPVVEVPADTKDRRERSNELQAAKADASPNPKADSPARELAGSKLAGRAAALADNADNDKGADDAYAGESAAKERDAKKAPAKPAKDTPSPPAAAAAAPPPAPVTVPAPDARGPGLGAPPTSVSGGSGAYRTADETKNSFLEQMKARKVAQIEKEKVKAKTEAKKKAPSSSSSSAPKVEDSLTPTEAREELERQKRLDQASAMMTAAERELANGRPLEAADLAGRAEALGGSSVGLVPASTQARGFFQAKRFADSARVGSRLLQGDPADVVLVDGMIAGADAALAIGDRRLAERLLLRALLPANKDPARRAQAQSRLNTMRQQQLLRESEAPAPAAAAPSKSSAPAESSLDADQQ